MNSLDEWPIAECQQRPYIIAVQNTAKSSSMGTMYLLIWWAELQKNKIQVERVRRKGGRLLTFEDPLRKGRFPLHWKWLCYCCGQHWAGNFVIKKDQKSFDLMLAALPKHSSSVCPNNHIDQWFNRQNIKVVNEKCSRVCRVGNCLFK